MDDRIVRICGEVAEGKTIRQIAAGMGISCGQVLKIVHDGGEEAEKHYTRARDAAADIFETDIIEAALSASPESAPADRIKVDALKWVAARRAPKRYSERIQQEVTGKDGGPLQTVSEIVVTFTSASDESQG